MARRRANNWENPYIQQKRHFAYAKHKNARKNSRVMIQTVSAASSAKRQDEALTTLHESAQAKYQKIVSNNYIYINVYECMCVVGAVNCSKTKGQVLKKEIC